MRYHHNRFDGISYKKIKDEITYELPKPKPPAEPKLKTLRQLKNDRDNTLSSIGMFQNIPELADVCEKSKQRLANIEKEIEERFGKDALSKIKGTVK